MNFCKMKHEVSSAGKVFATEVAEVVLADTSIVWERLEVVRIYLCAVCLQDVSLHVLSSTITPAVITLDLVLMIKASEDQLGIGIVLVSSTPKHPQNAISDGSRFSQSLGRTIDIWVNRERKNFFGRELVVGIRSLPRLFFDSA